MRVRAVLAQNAESNALGSVELECLPEGLLIVHLAVGSAGPGYAVGAVARGTQTLVPWPSIERLEQHSDYVFVDFDVKLSRHHRLCLTHFTSSSDRDPQELAKQQRIVRFGSIGLALAVAISLSAQIPSWSERTSQWTALGIGFAAACCVMLIGLAYERLWVGRGPASEDIMSQVVAQMQHYRPVLRAPAVAESEEFDWHELIQRLPRSATGLIIVLTAAGLALVSTSGWLAPNEQASRRVAQTAAQETLARPGRAAPPSPRDPEDALPAAHPPNITAPKATTAAEVVTEPAKPTQALQAASLPEGEACRCERADSILWGPGFPRITTLLIEKSIRRHNEHQHIELELGAINNGSQSLEDVHLSVLFFEGDGVEPIRERPLYYEGPLRPGQAIKWHVQARGTRFEIRSPTREVLKDRAKDFAPADALAQLLSQANHRPVRLHAAMMLAYLGDARSKAGAQSLRDALRESEAPYLDRVLAAQNQVLSCDWRAASTGRKRAVSACIYNHTSARAGQIEMRVRALDRHFDHRNPTADPPVVIAEQLLTLPGVLEPTQGLRVGLELDTDNADGRPPVAFEVLVDHADNR